MPSPFQVAGGQVYGAVQLEEDRGCRGTNSVTDEARTTGQQIDVPSAILVQRCQGRAGTCREGLSRPEDPGSIAEQDRHD